MNRKLTLPAANIEYDHATASPPRGNVLRSLRGKCCSCSKCSKQFTIGLIWGDWAAIGRQPPILLGIVGHEQRVLERSTLYRVDIGEAVPMDRLLVSELRLPTCL